MSVTEATTNKAAARFVVVEFPTASPGNCGACGKSKHDEGFVYTAMDFEFFGTLFFCADCAKEIGRSVGCMDPEQTVVVNNKLIELTDELNSCRAQLEQLSVVRDAFEYYSNAFPINHNLVNPAISNVRELFQSKEFESVSTVNGSEFGETINDAELPDSDTTEPVSVEGSDDSSNVTGDDFLGSLLS